MKALIPALIVLLIAVAARAEDDLPRVLILADSVHRQATQAAAKELQGRVRIEFPKTTYPGDTSTAIAQLNDLLGDGDWDLIYFNFGFADLHYRDPNIESIRAMSKHAGGVRVSMPGLYEANLRKLVERLKATGAKLIWASTTPIESSKYDNLYDPGSEIEFNQIAAKIMKEHDVPVTDMHAWILANVKDKRDPSPFAYNRITLHPPIVAAILENLPKTP